MSYSSLYNDVNAARLEMEDFWKKRQILRQLRDNDPTLTYVGVGRDESDSSWLGYFIGKNNHLQELYMDMDARLRYFFEGLSHNSSIRKLSLDNVCERGLFSSERGRLRYVFQNLIPFFKNNRNLEEIEIDMGDGYDARASARDYQLMAMAIGECSGSLTKFSLNNPSFYYSSDGVSQDGGRDTNCIPLALSMHPKLRKIHFNGVDTGLGACIAFGTLFRNSANELEDLCIKGSGIGDEEVLALVDGLTHCNKLRRFYLYSDVGTISNIGWKSLSTLLEVPGSNLENLHLDASDITDEQAQMMANALRCNKKLKILSVYYEEGDIGKAWSVFTKVICDTSNISSTYQSNHTINVIGAGRRVPRAGESLVLNTNGRVLRKLKSLLVLNTNANKKEVAMTKILKHYRNVFMEPFFEWDLKVLPLVISWFERAADLTTDFETHIVERKLLSIYQFVRAMPMLAIGRPSQV